MMQPNANFKETVILVDADFADNVAFDLTVNFERMLMRRIPQADLSTWLVCMALDGGVPEGRNEVQAVFLHSRQKSLLQNFTPADFSEIDGKAFDEPRMGEFFMSAVADEGMTGKSFFVECTEALLGSEEVKRLVLVPDMARYAEGLKALLARDGRRKEVTLLAMQPESGREFQCEILGYSLMQALGIRGDELKD